MFSPNYHYTNKIVRSLTTIAEARTIILNAPLVPKWEISLRREALIRSAHCSTAIEGNPLSLEEVSALAAGRDIMVRRKDKQEVLNYLEALERIPEYVKKTPFASGDLLEIHKVVTKDVLENPEDEGAFRSHQVVVGNRLTGEIIFRPPSTRQVRRLTDDFFEWFNSQESDEIDPVIKAGITHYEIVRIHPFADGNGRTARIMATLLFYKRGFDVKRFFALDDYYDHDRRGYYAALKSVDRETLDITGWLEYFSDGVEVSLKSVRDKVIGLSKDVKVLKEKGQIALTERQIKIVERIIQNDKITVGDVSREFRISRQAALKEINKLVKMGIVQLRGKGRGAYYILV